MKQIKELDIEEKTRTDISVFDTLKDVINRVERLEETKSDKMYYRLPPVNLSNYSLVYIDNINENSIINLHQQLFYV